MGLYKNIEDKLPGEFSIFQFMSLLGMEAYEVRKARNILKQFYLAGYIIRLSKNMYKKKEEI